MATNKKRKKKKSRQDVVILLLSVAIVAVVLFTAITAAVSRKRDENSSAPVQTTASLAETTEEKAKQNEVTESKTALAAENNIPTESKTSAASKSTDSTTAAKPKKSESGRIIVDTDAVEWNLIVVSLTREIPEGYKPEVVEVVNSGHDLDKRVAPYYEKMYYAAKKEGIILTPFSGNRSYERQRINYNNLTETYMTRYGIDRKAAQKKAATVILPPGTSEHNIGLAMDICNTYDSFANSKEYAWLTKNAYKYGFILRYPKGKEDVTGIVYEPWHWRFVGTEYAKKIRDSGLCLEEYLDSVGIAY